MPTIEIVYQHADFVIINKPEGISVHKDNEIEGITQIVARQLDIRQVWLVHRLDKSTSGLLILALNAHSASILSQLFAEHLVEKSYLALSDHKPKKKQGWITGDMQKARRGAWKLMKSKENLAQTWFCSISCAPNLRLFLLKPKTGKTHQLRVAMKSLGCPILGDSLYAGTACDRVYLHAYQLQFQYQNQLIIVRALPQTGAFFMGSAVQDLLPILVEKAS